MTKKEIIDALAKKMRPEHFKKMMDDNWSKELLEKLLIFYNDEGNRN